MCISVYYEIIIISVFYYIVIHYQFILHLYLLTTTLQHVKNNLLNVYIMLINAN